MPVLSQLFKMQKETSGKKLPSVYLLVNRQQRRNFYPETTKYDPIFECLLTLLQLPAHAFMFTKTVRGKESRKKNPAENPHQCKQNCSLCAEQTTSHSSSSACAAVSHKR